MSRFSSSASKSFASNGETLAPFALRVRPLLRDELAVGAGMVTSLMYTRLLAIDDLTHEEKMMLKIEERNQKQSKVAKPLETSGLALDMTSRSSNRKLAANPTKVVIAGGSVGRCNCIDKTSIGTSNRGFIRHTRRGQARASLQARPDILPMRLISPPSRTLSIAICLIKVTKETPMSVPTSMYVDHVNDVAANACRFRHPAALVLAADQV